MLKNTKLSEKQNLEFRAEFFNIFNRANFDQPNSVFATSSFGRVFNTLGLRSDLELRGRFSSL